ncbi:MAG: hypothetical protein MUD16_07330 [Desulfobacterales bacterium]|jgi:hypothetical protein|nr:hypothetical protein [Desulfobacterales bacterium]
MSIRLIAKDLYRLQQEAARWERELAAAPAERREELADRLRRVRAERDRLRAALDGQKQTSR